MSSVGTLRTVLAALLVGLAGESVAELARSKGFLLAYVVLRPLAYRLYPRLRRSDARYLRHGPNAQALAATGFLIALGAVFLNSWTYGVVALVLIAVGGVFALAIRWSHIE